MAYVVDRIERGVVQRIFVALCVCMFLIGGGTQVALAGQGPSPQAWHASWVTHPHVSPRAPVVLHFRREVRIQTRPQSYIVRVSADNRFILYANGQRVGDGPARGDLGHWRYERFDLAPYLQAGDNYITAVVWNFGIYSPTAQISDRTAFLLQSDGTGGEDISTPTNWLVEQEVGHQPIPRGSSDFPVQLLSGPGSAERVQV